MYLVREPDWGSEAETGFQTMTWLRAGEQRGQGEDGDADGDGQRARRDPEGLTATPPNAAGAAGHPPPAKRPPDAAELPPPAKRARSADDPAARRERMREQRRIARRALAARRRRERKRERRRVAKREARKEARKAKAALRFTTAADSVLGENPGVLAAVAGFLPRRTASLVSRAWRHRKIYDTTRVKIKFNRHHFALPPRRRVDAFLALVSTLPNLVSVTIQDGVIGDDDLIAIVEAVPKLVMIKVSACPRITADAVVRLADPARARRMIMEARMVSKPIIRELDQRGLWKRGRYSI